MTLLSQASEVIRKAEVELRQLLLRTAEQGDYEAARMLAEWGRQLKQMAERSGSVVQEPRSMELVNGPRPSQAKPDGFAPTTRNYTIDRKGDSKQSTRAKKAKGRRDQYPKFLRDGEELLKIGWSKREKKVYRHKAPQRVVLLVSQALQQAGQHGDRFMMEQILPIRDPENDADVPTYQAYLSLAWLRKENLIVQHGRQGYSLRPNVNLTNSFEERWKLLPKS